MPSYTVSTDAPVLVTGATGYLAGWIVKRLLEEGVTVHAAVRDPDDAEKTRHLRDIAATAPGTLRFFAADLLDEGSYNLAMKDCGIVFHTASPFTTSVDDPQRDLIDPALKGTRNVLGSVQRTDSVHRVVLTSSCAAIYTDAVETHDGPGGRIDETVWNTTASIDNQPYSYSKTLAEKAAWEMSEGQGRWRLVTINPALILGPALQDKPTSESVNIVRMLGDGTMKQGAPRFGIGAVDVRDVAEAHVAAAYLPDAQGRHIVTAESTDFYELGRMLSDRYGEDYPLPTRPMPKWLIWAVGPWVARMPRRTISRNVDEEFRADNAKGKRELGLDYMPIKRSINDMFAQMIEAGLLKKR